MLRRIVFGMAGIAVLFAGGWYVAIELSPTGPPRTTQVIERDELRLELSKLDLLQDDRLDDKNPVFDPGRVDSRLVELSPSYVAAAQRLQGHGYPILPSI